MAEDEQRVLAFPNGEEGTLLVSKVAPGRFRIENFIGFAVLSESFPGDLPEDVGVGWIIEGDELEDGRLQVRRIVPDPNIESVSGFLIPPDFAHSVEFETLSAAIITMGGKWEVVAQGLFSAYVPKGNAEEKTFSLEGNLERALKDWIKRESKSAGGTS